MRLILLGGPGSGKGTQGHRLAARLGVAHIASGDLLRAQVEAGTELGRTVAGYLDTGQLVPDELVFDLVMAAALRAAQHGGYILDGFPRTVQQAVKAEQVAGPSGASAQRVIFLAVPRQVLVDRLLARAAEEGRSDDILPVILERLDVFDSETSPLIAYFRAAGLLAEVAADGTEDEVMAAILAALQPARDAAELRPDASP
jgi:adenylate kinase